MTDSRDYYQVGGLTEENDKTIDLVSDLELCCQKRGEMPNTGRNEPVVFLSQLRPTDIRLSSSRPVSSSVSNVIYRY